MSETMTTSSPLTDSCKRLWAKSSPRHPLWKHLLDAAAVSLALPPPAESCGWGAEETAFLVGLHDIGKADSCFQHQCFSDELRNAGYPITADARCRHERISARFISKLIGGSGSLAADAISRTAAAHHGYWNESARDVAPEYAKAQQQLYVMLKQALEIDAFPNETPSDLSNFGMRLAGHIVLCDWIASNEKFFGDNRLQDKDDPQSYFAEARKVASEWVDRLGLKPNRKGGNAGCVVTTPRPIQQALLDTDIPPGLVIIEAPMGEGKTEAAWILAEKWRDKGYHGMYVALPTMATSDSLYRRYRDDYLKKMERGEDVKLVHGMAWLRDDNEPEKPPEVGEPGDDRSLAAAWFRPTRRAMLAAHGVGTVDQAMLAGMNVKFGFLRLCGLADQVLVIDEVHAYDAYMSAIICRLLQWCACIRIPVILLSATLSAKQRAAMLEAYGATDGDPGPNAPYPLITVAEPGKEAWTITPEPSSSRTLKIETHPGLLGDAKKTAAKADELVKDGGCCCVILNTVKQAQAVYKALKVSENEKLLFHSRFMACDRQRITKRVLDLFGKDSNNRPEKFVLVATQVVEQSLDVDFDHMISEIAPVDLLLQRSGRMHRHRERDYDPTLHVLLPEARTPRFGATSRVYAAKPLLRTLAILASTSKARLPDDFRLLIERCYGSDEWEQSAVLWETIRAADSEWDTDTEMLGTQAKQFALLEPSKRFFRPVGNDPAGDDSDDGNGWRAKTRLGANDRTALLVEEARLDSIRSGELPMREVRDLYQRSLKLPGYLPIHSPAQGYSAGVEASGGLRGLVLLPIASDGSWRGVDDRGNTYQVTYDAESGLTAGRVQ
jgi:CRISPR-associated endonuclease/helicase Cas3